MGAAHVRAPVLGGRAGFWAPGFGSGSLSCCKHLGNKAAIGGSLCVCGLCLLMQLRARDSSPGTGAAAICVQAWVQFLALGEGWLGPAHMWGVEQCMHRLYFPLIFK